MKWLTTRLVLCLFTFFLNTGVLPAQQFKWVTGGGTDASLSPSRLDEGTYYMCTDPNGNVYALSQVGYGPVFADTFYSSGYSSEQNLLITSYTCNGQMRWAKLIASADGIVPYAITADDAGHIYVAGQYVHFTGTLFIGDDTAISSEIYLGTGLIQLDTLGNFDWIRFVGTNAIATLSDVFGGPLTVDASNNVHYFCYIKSGIPIMPGDTSAFGTYDVVYNPSGAMLSAVRLDMDSEWVLNGAVIDPATNKLYVSGQTNPGLITPSMLDSGYAAAFDASRSLLWQYFCGHGDDDALDGVVLGPDKNLYFSGASQGTAVFSFHGDSVVGAGIMAVIMKTDTDGNVNWIKYFYEAGTSINAFYSIALLPNYKVAAIGTFAGRTTDGTVSLSTPPGDGYSPFLVVVDSGENLLAIQQIYGDGFYNAGKAITADKVGNIYVGGEVVDSIWAGAPPIPAYHTVGGNSDFFVMKYGVDCSCTSGPIAAYTETGTRTIDVAYTGTTAGLDSVVWNFADGSTATGATASHTYTLAGTYHVCATVYTYCGRDIYCSNVIIICGLPPVASFTKTGTNVLSVTYTGTTSTVDSVGWIFGDGGRDTGAAVTHTYTAIGVYEVCAVAHSICGNDTSCHYDTVICVGAPIASFTSTGSSTINVTYTGTTTAIDSIGWLFGDGSRGSGSMASHTYTTPGIYNVCVVGYCPCGNDTACNADTVFCISAPVASFTDTGTITVGTTYTGTTTGVDSTVWNFGDGSSTVTGTTAIHTYSAIGTYHVCVTVYSPCGSNTSCKYDTVLCVTAPVASFTDTGTHAVGFIYTGTTVDIDSVVWGFGDGHTATGMTSLHTYTASGTYHVCVTTYTGCGIDSVCNDISVLVPNSITIVSALESIKVFPNPANDELGITGLTEKMNYRLLSVTGNCMAQGNLQQPSDNISMHDIVPGVYVLELTGLDGEKDMVRVVKE